MKDIPHANGKDRRGILERPRARRDAAKMLGVALAVRYRKFLETADDQDENARATAELAQCMYENVEFVIWALKHIGGLNPPPPEELRRISPAANQNRAPLPEMPTALALDALGQDIADLGECTCPPLEHGIIGRDRHMTSCPKFKP